MSTQIFISYSHADTVFATRLAGDLEKLKYEVWFDRTDIQTGARWDDEIVKGLDASAVFVVLLSDTSTVSQNVKDEIGYAIDHNKQILPLLIEPCEVPFRLRRVQYVDFTTMKYNDGILTVLKIIQSFFGTGGKIKPTTESVKYKPAPKLKNMEEKKMPKKKNSASNTDAGDRFNISISGNSNVAAVGRGASAALHQAGADSGMEAWCREMERKINSLGELYPEDKSTLNQQVGQIASEIEKGTKADAGRVERMLNMIGVMAPDILEVAITTLISPLSGIGLVAKKIGDKAQVRKA